MGKILGVVIVVAAIMRKINYYIKEENIRELWHSEDKHPKLGHVNAWQRRTLVLVNSFYHVLIERLMR